jgi:uncharacterized protein (DUF934 family)
VTYDPWHKIEEDNLQTETTPSFSILPLEVFSEVHDWPEKCKPFGAWFKADIELNLLTQEILSLPLLCIDVDNFNHGQVFSLATMIKQNLNYQGELRVMGNLLLDQLPYLCRCGIDSFSLTDQSDWEYALFVLRQAPSQSRFQYQFS